MQITRWSESGWGVTLLILPGDDVLDVLAEPFYRLDLRPGTRHQLGVVAVGQVEFYIVFQPVE